MVTGSDTRETVGSFSGLLQKAGRLLLIQTSCSLEILKNKKGISDQPLADKNLI